MTRPDTPVVLLSQRLGAVTEEELRLESTGAIVRGAPLWTTDEIARNAADADVIILGAVEPFDAAALDALPRLKVIVRRGVGVDNVDVDAATSQGILVANVPDASVEEVSDHALALLLALERGLHRLDAAVRAGLWARDPREVEAIRSPIRRLSTLSLGIVGFGRIGRALHRKAAAVYGRVITADPMLTATQAEVAGIELVSVQTLLSESDHISLHAPLVPDTRHLIDARAIRRMRPGAILVNTSRGGLVDEDALVHALESRHLRAAGIDVTEQEPLNLDSALMSCQAVLLTAHSAASSQTTRFELAARSVDAALAVLNGELPASVVNDAVLDSPALRMERLSRVR